MTEIREITVTEINKRCPKCNIGYLKFIKKGISILGIFLYNIHECTSCDKKTYYTFNKYPIIKK